LRPLFVEKQFLGGVQLNLELRDSLKLHVEIRANHPDLIAELVDQDTQTLIGAAFLPQFCTQSGEWPGAGRH
jgi:hypothetical protein